LAGSTHVPSFHWQMRSFSVSLQPSYWLPYNPHIDRLEWRFSPKTFICRWYVAGFIFAFSGRRINAIRYEFTSNSSKTV
jgi:hypothetical protein